MPQSFKNETECEAFWKNVIYKEQEWKGKDCPKLPPNSKKICNETHDVAINKAIMQQNRCRIHPNKK